MGFLSCIFGCVSMMGCRNTISRKFAFFPPKPPGYILKQKGENLYDMALLDEQGQEIETFPFPYIQESIFYIQTERGNRIPCIFYQKEGNELTIIFSHGNSTDIGIMRNHMIDMLINLKCNILSYEYSGYGSSIGEKPSERNTFCDIRAAYLYLTQTLKIPWHQIIIYGQSVGSGPSCDLARNFPVLGVVLHSPLASGLLIFSRRKQSTNRFDLYKNLDKVHYIKCPTFIIHGQDDNIIPVQHGQWLFESCKQPWPAWFVPGGDHNSLEIRFRSIYFVKLKEFITGLKLLKQKYIDQDLLELFLPRLTRAEYKIESIFNEAKAMVMEEIVQGSSGLIRSHSF